MIDLRGVAPSAEVVSMHVHSEKNEVWLQEVRASCVGLSWRQQHLTMGQQWRWGSNDHAVGSAAEDADVGEAVGAGAW